MKAKTARLRIAGSAGMALLVLAVAAPLSVRAEGPQIAQARPAVARLKLDVGKGRIERPTEGLLAGTNGGIYAANSTFINPKVEPGKVRWHGDFAAARAAAARSGKPVLLFQMMGKLDDQFC